VAIDSTKPDVDEGEVGREHYGWFDAELRVWMEGPRIVVIHDHISPCRALAVISTTTATPVMWWRSCASSRSTWCCPDTAMCRTCGEAPGRAWCTRVPCRRCACAAPCRRRDNVIESDADEVRIGMREPGQGLQGEERLARLAPAGCNQRAQRTTPA
jgi:3',5'-cyclic-AMP phosphodiesterase